MKPTLKIRLLADEIDDLVDGALTDASRAEELKRELRKRLRAVPDLHTVPRVQADSADDFDLWENVPV